MTKVTLSPPYEITETEVQSFGPVIRLHHIRSAIRVYCFFYGRSAEKLKQHSETRRDPTITTTVIACRMERWRKETADLPLSEVGDDLSSTTLTLVLVQG